MLAVFILGQGTLAQTTLPATRPIVGIVSFNFPDNVEIRSLVDYVSERLGVTILYDEQLSKKENTVTIRAPNGIPSGSLLEFLQSVLRMKGYALVTSPEGDVRQVVPLTSAAAVRATSVEFVKLRFAESSRLAPQIKQMLSAMKRPGDQDAGVEVTFDERTNQLGAIGSAEAVAAALKIAKSLDQPVTGEENPIRFYKLTNATAADVLDTIRALEGETTRVTTRDRGDSRTARRPADSLAGAGGGSPMNSAGGGYGAGGGGLAIASAPVRASSSTTATPPADGPRESEARSVDVTKSSATGGQDPARRAVSVTADTNTNTIIVRGGAGVQQMYETLIKTLDKRRPQVLLEATVVTLDTSNDFHVGVEVSASAGIGSTQLLNFTQFGLSQVDPKTGRLAIAPTAGFNGAVIRSDVANVVVQALTSTKRARVQSAPRVLVNDNATGTLTSIAEQPFTSVNASTTIATTSFGGYADAGTTITLTPHISEGDYLQLEYSVELSSFTGLASTASGTPPPRQSDRVESKVTIPDGSTIIVGGLSRRQFSREIRRVPILGDIPILEYLFSDRLRSLSTTTLFVFLRPVILRDDRFDDLRNVSEGDLKAASMPSNFPRSDTSLMR